MFVIMGGYFQLFSFHVLFLFIYAIVKKKRKFFSEKYKTVETLFSPYLLLLYSFPPSIIVVALVHTSFGIKAFASNHIDG